MALRQRPLRTSHSRMVSSKLPLAWAAGRGGAGQGGIGWVAHTAGGMQLSCGLRPATPSPATPPPAPARPARTSALLAESRIHCTNLKIFSRRQHPTTNPAPPSPEIQDLSIKIFPLRFHLPRPAHQQVAALAECAGQHVVGVAPQHAQAAPALHVPQPQAGVVRGGGQQAARAVPGAVGEALQRKWQASTPLLHFLGAQRRQGSAVRGRAGGRAGKEYPRTALSLPLVPPKQASTGPLPCLGETPPIHRAANSAGGRSRALGELSPGGSRKKCFCPAPTTRHPGARQGEAAPSAHLRAQQRHELFWSLFCSVLYPSKKGKGKQPRPPAHLCVPLQRAQQLPGVGVPQLGGAVSRRAGQQAPAPRKLDGRHRAAVPHQAVLRRGATAQTEHGLELSLAWLERASAHCASRALHPSPAPTLSSQRKQRAGRCNPRHPQRSLEGQEHALHSVALSGTASGVQQ